MLGNLKAEKSATTLPLPNGSTVRVRGVERVPGVPVPSTVRL
jgi:hypothetical protein